MSSSSKEEDKENASCVETYEEGNIAALEAEESDSGKQKPASQNGHQEEVCVPDSSNNEPEEEPASDDCPEEQHSSGSVDEELLEEDDTMDTGDTKTAEEEIPESSESSKTEKVASPSNPQSLVGELMNKFGFNDILEYQEAYRKAVQESREATDEIADNNNEEETKKATNGLKLRSDITIDPERNFSDLSKSEILRNFETLKRLRPELGVSGHGHERETLFAGEWTKLNETILVWQFKIFAQSGLWKPTGFGPGHGGLGMFPGGRGGFGGRGRGGFRGGRRSVSQFPVPPLPPGVNLPPIEPSAIKVKWSGYLFSSWAWSL